MADCDCSHILCCICELPIPRGMWVQASLWHDPAGVVCVAHNDCLVSLGDRVSNSGPNR